MLEDILDKIEEGTMDKDILLSLDFLNLKQSGAHTNPNSASKTKLPSVDPSKVIKRGN